MPRVSIIIPVYNAEKYIERCVRSLMEQTLDDLELVFVDDCCNDESFKILSDTIESYTNTKKQIKIITHGSNRGVACTRQTGLNASKGEYILFCDSDDWMHSDMCRLLYSVGEQYKSDIVICDYSIAKSHQIIPVGINEYESNVEYVNAILNGDIGSYLWNKMVRRDLFRQVNFIEGIDYWEDLLVCTQLFYYAQSVKLAKSVPLYFYNNKNQASITSSVDSHKIKSMINSVCRIESFLSQHNIDTSILNFRKTRCKMLMMTQGVDINKWHEVFPEVNQVMVNNNEIALYLRMVIITLNRRNYFVYNLYRALKDFIYVFNNR